MNEDRVKGSIDKVAGKAQAAVGDLAGDSKTEVSGRVREVRGVPAPWPKVLGDGRLGRAAVRVNELLIRSSRTLFSYQIFVVADCVPGVRFVLDDSRSRSGPGLPE